MGLFMAAQVVPFTLGELQDNLQQGLGARVSRKTLSKYLKEHLGLRYKSVRPRSQRYFEPECLLQR